MTTPPDPPAVIDTLRQLDELLTEIRLNHRDPAHEGYNECEKDECAWCSQSRELMQQAIHDRSALQQQIEALRQEQTRPATAEEQEPLVDRLALLMVEIFNNFAPEPQRPDESLDAFGWRVRQMVLDNVRAALRQVLVVAQPSQQRITSLEQQIGEMRKERTTI